LGTGKITPYAKVPPAAEGAIAAAAVKKAVFDVAAVRVIPDDLARVVDAFCNGLDAQGIDEGGISASTTPGRSSGITTTARDPRASRRLGLMVVDDPSIHGT
jgi:hypothetical protein